MTSPTRPPETAFTGPEPAPEPAVCLRCRTPGPVNDDGFCDRCEKALEQACL